VSSGATLSAANSIGAVYPQTTPFDPGRCFPEYFGPTASEENAAFDLVRDSLRLAKLDSERFNTPQWNPLERYLGGKKRILVKPNFVKHEHLRDPEGWRYVLTHGSVIRAVLEYVFLAAPEAEVVIADAPQTDSSFDNIVQILGMRQVVQAFSERGFRCSLRDLRKEEWTLQNGVVTKRRRLEGDIHGYVPFDLAGSSEFRSHRGAGRYYGADYETSEVNYHHSDGRHEYLISGTAMWADAVVSIPKMKTHKKAGVTGALKNLVGINGDKNWLPHHTEGTPKTGGDERPDSTYSSERKLVNGVRSLLRSIPFGGAATHRVARSLGLCMFGSGDRVIRSGNWSGNDTVWRMCLDLNKILRYGWSDGSIGKMGLDTQRPHLVFVDGVIGGQGNGPMDPDPIASNLIIFADNPSAADAAMTVLMGYDPELVPIVRQSFHVRHYSLSEGRWQDLPLHSNRIEWNTQLGQISQNDVVKFKPHFGWSALDA
jgi:uncharacterized protein (DUF362 family)